MGTCKCGKRDWNYGPYECGECDIVDFADKVSTLFNGKWTEEQDAELKRLHEAGLSFGEIGKSIGRTKNAIIGRAHRLKYYTRDRIKLEKIAPINVEAIVKKSTHCAPLPDWEYQGGIDIMSLREGICRFPTEKDLYCGGPVTRGAYCHHHAETCYQPKRKKR